MAVRHMMIVLLSNGQLYRAAGLHAIGAPQATYTSNRSREASQSDPDSNGNCPPGKYLKEVPWGTYWTTLQCWDCTWETYKAGTNKKRSCDNCPLGREATQPVQSACEKCPAGYASTLGAGNNCFKCSPGRYASAPGTPTCEVCPSGKFSKRGWYECRANPTDAPTAPPTERPTPRPTPRPTNSPTPAPTLHPTEFPSALPTSEPTASPTAAPAVVVPANGIIPTVGPPPTGYAHFRGACKGDNMVKVMEPPEGCAAQCDLDPCCKGFSKAPLSEKCWLKSAACASPDTSSSWDWYAKLLDTSSLCGPAGAGHPAGSLPSTAASIVTPGQPLGPMSATGDPHMQNILGQRFDLMQEGKHTLLQIPREAGVANTLLHVQASAEHDGGACADMYFKTLNITGEWADERQKGGFAYISDSPEKVSGWQTFGSIDMKVAWGHTKSGTTYLNFYVKHLKRVDHDIGGILGLDDYRPAAKAAADCADTVILLATDDNNREVSEATADM